MSETVEVDNLATSRKELRDRKVIDITHYLRVRASGQFSQELFYLPEYVLLTKAELTGLLDLLDKLDSGSKYQYIGVDGEVKP